MSAHLVFATSNAHKVSELEAILAPAWEGFEDGCVARMSDFDVASPVDDGVTFELAKGIALLVMSIGAHNKGFNRVRTGKRRKSIQEGLCLHHHGALNEGVDLGKLTRRGQGQGHEYLSEKCLGAVRSE